MHVFSTYKSAEVSFSINVLSWKLNGLMSYKTKVEKIKINELIVLLSTSHQCLNTNGDRKYTYRCYYSYVYIKLYK